jgi:3',5'-cyclic AMP phosphodiesterase CpdA
MKLIRHIVSVSSLVWLTAVLLLPLYAASAPPQPAGALFRFVAYGDTRTHHDIHQQIVDAVLQCDPDLVLQTGDLVSDGGNAAQWRKFDEITAKLRDKTPYYPARGNHDTGGTGYEDHVTQPFRPGGTKLYYAFDKENIRFISLDTEEGIKPESAEYQWLVKELASAKADHKLVVPFFHVAIFSIGSHGSNHALRHVLHPLFKEYGVKLVFQGHDHNYYRTVRDGITYVVTGGGGAPLYPDAHREQGQEGDTFAEINHFCLCDVFKDKIVLMPLTKTLDPVEPPVIIPF